MTNQEITIESEFNRRMELVNCPKFRASCVELAKKLGINANEWNENKAGLLMMFANEFCKIENRL